MHKQVSNAIERGVDAVDHWSENKLGVDIVKQDGDRFQMRVIVYSTTRVKNSDLYFIVSLGNLQRSTDCHYRLTVAPVLRLEPSA